MKDALDDNWTIGEVFFGNTRFDIATTKTFGQNLPRQAFIR